MKEFKETLIVKFEHTDLFGGETNYSWVNRGELRFHPTASDRDIVRGVKEELGMSGVPCDRQDWRVQDGMALKPRRIHQIIFITFEVIKEEA